jgi:hypothetical protein
MDFSECICDCPGFCPIYGKVMEANPPNWQWCKNTTTFERIKYFDLLSKAPDSANKRIVKLLQSANYDIKWFLLYYLSEIKFHRCHKSIETQRHRNSEIISYIESQQEVDVDFDNVQILSLGHKQSQFDSIEDRPYLKKVNLNSVDAGEYSDNKWAESRAFLDDSLFRDDVEFVGFTTASWNEKYEGYARIDNFHNWDNAKVLLRSKPEDKIVLCADMFCPCVWIDDKGILSDFFNSSAGFIGRNFLKLIGLSCKHLQAPFSNQLICHKSIVQKYKQFLQDNEVMPKIEWIVQRYSDKIKQSTDIQKNYHANRLHAYFMEMVSCFWFVNQDFMYIPNVNRKETWYSVDGINQRIANDSK